jgi:hypothetical protein
MTRPGGDPAAVRADTSSRERRMRAMSVGDGSGAPEAGDMATETPTPERRNHAHSRSLRLVLVRWHDAWFDLEQPAGGWRDDYLVQTVGFLVREGPDVVSIAQELLPGRDGYRAVTHIPRGIIESISTLFEEDGPARRVGDRELRHEA